MRSLSSLKREEAKLRERHTQQTQAGKWKEAQTTRVKMIGVLNQISANKPT